MGKIMKYDLLNIHDLIFCIFLKKKTKQKIQGKKGNQQVNKNNLIFKQKFGNP